MQSNRGKRGQDKLKGEQWIQLQDFRKPTNQALSEKFALQEGRLYRRPPIEQQSPKQETDPFSVPPRPNPSKDIQNIQNQYTQPLHSIPKTTKVSPSLPMMEVTCQICTTIQSVPGNTQVYICGACQNFSECYPLYGIVLCGCCQSKVGFGFGVSQFVRCLQCSSVNKVPLQPTKQYKGLEKHHILHQQLSQHQYFNFQQLQKQEQCYSQFSEAKKAVGVPGESEYPIFQSSREG